MSGGGNDLLQQRVLASAAVLEIDDHEFATSHSTSLGCGGRTEVEEGADQGVTIPEAVPKLVVQPNHL
ncbi:hypothetical protein EPN29_09295 [bacterium]|nr:MAG: hypothetical protein EPN29_09295 [bacterium]